MLSMQTRLVLPAFIVTLMLSSNLCGQPSPATVSASAETVNVPNVALNTVAESYVRLVLAVGQHDPDYVDAYYGPPEWRQEAERTKKPLAELAVDAQTLAEKLRSVDSAPLQGLLRQRYSFLATQIRAVGVRISMLMGRKLSFDEESRLLYDAVLPEFPPGHFEGIRAKLDKLLLGDGSLFDRLEQYENRFVVPKDKVDAVMRAAIAECRRRTLNQIKLPENEDFRLEFVTGQPWSAYNWYKGGAQSLIQVNLDLPFRLTQAILLAGHEGYPGHHVFNVLLEQKLVRENGWIENQVSPLFSPQMVIAEGSADFGVDVVFPMTERVNFTRDTLFPLAGFDPSEAARYCDVMKFAGDLSSAGSLIQRSFLDGKLTRDEALQRLAAEALIPRPRAEKALKFAQHNRAYLVTYKAGYQLVKHYVETRGGTIENEARRWEILRDLLSAPLMPADLKL